MSVDSHRETRGVGGIVQPSKQHGGSANSLILILSLKWNHVGNWAWPDHGDINPDQGQGRSAAKQEGVINQLAGCLGTPRVGEGRGGLADAGKDGCVVGCDVDVSGHGSQPGAADLAVVAGQQTAAKVFLFDRVGEIAKSLQVKGLNFEGKIVGSGVLAVAGQSRAKDLCQGKQGCCDNEKSEIHGCKKRSSSRFQISRLCSDRMTTECTETFSGTRK